MKDGEFFNITGLEVALLLNFKESKLTWKRVVRGATGVRAGGITTDFTDDTDGVKAERRAAAVFARSGHKYRVAQ